MASTIALKRRIRSVKNTRQITKAMELVAASKMRRAQEAALASRAYRNLARQILTRLRELTKVDRHPLFQQRPVVRAKLYVMITSDRGLAGAYNSGVLRVLARALRQDREQNISVKLIAIGKKGAGFVSRLESVEVVAAYDDFADNPTAADLQPVLATARTLFIDGKVDAVDVIYTDYKSSIKQEVTVDRLLPAAHKDVKITPDLGAAIFEPSPQAVLDSISERLVEVQLWQALLEAHASEHASRMMAMKTASDNAGDLIDDLTISMNTARQASITQELAEITGGAEAMQ